MKRLLTSLMLLIAITAVVLTTLEKHGQNVDWTSLELTDQQNTQLHIIRDDYVKNFQALRHQTLDAETKKQELLQLREQMVVEFKSLLSDKQQLLASEAIIDEMESRIDKRLARVVRELILTPKQEVVLKQLLSKKFDELQEEMSVLEIPDFNDRQQMFDQLDDVFPLLLTGEQLELWQHMKHKQALHLQSLQKSEKSALYLFG